MSRAGLCAEVHIVPAFPSVAVTEIWLEERRLQWTSRRWHAGEGAAGLSTRSDGVHSEGACCGLLGSNAATARRSEQSSSGGWRPGFHKWELNVKAAGNLAVWAYEAAGSFPLASLPPACFGVFPGVFLHHLVAMGSGRDIGLEPNLVLS